MLVDAIMVGDDQKSADLLSGTDGPLRHVILHQSQILSALSQPITHERVNIHEAMLVLACLIFVVGLTCRYPILVSDALT